MLFNTELIFFEVNYESMYVISIFSTSLSFDFCCTGHAMWPAIVVDESLVGDRKGLSKISGGRSIPVQFFGTHDFARFICILILLDK